MKKLLFSCLWLLPTLTWAAVGSMGLEPITTAVTTDRPFTLQLWVNSPTQKVDKYQVKLTYDASILRVDATTPITNGADALANNIANIATAGTLVINGFDSAGKGPGLHLHLVTINFESLSVETTASAIALTVESLTTAGEVTIGAATPRPGWGNTIVTVRVILCGDADTNGIVDIVDSLSIVRRLVNLQPPPWIDVALADVNSDDRLSIIDAMHIARYYVEAIVPSGTCLVQ